MTVGELKQSLAKFADETEVVVPVRVWTKAYSVTQPSPFMVDGSFDGCAIWITLPESMYIATRK